MAITKATAFKPAAKKPAFKEGGKVTHAKHGNGKIVALVTLKNGLWLEVKFGDKKNPIVKKVRPSTVGKG